jgi:hypothetical protein
VPTPAPSTEKPPAEKESGGETGGAVDESMEDEDFPPQAPEDLGAGRPKGPAKATDKSAPPDLDLDLDLPPGKQAPKNTRPAEPQLPEGKPSVGNPFEDDKPDGPGLDDKPEAPPATDDTDGEAPAMKDDSGSEEPSSGEETPGQAKSMRWRSNPRGAPAGRPRMSAAKQNLSEPRRFQRTEPDKSAGVLATPIRPAAAPAANPLRYSAPSERRVLPTAAWSRQAAEPQVSTAAATPRANPLRAQ